MAARIFLTSSAPVSVSRNDSGASPSATLGSSIQRFARSAEPKTSSASDSIRAIRASRSDSMGPSLPPDLILRAMVASDTPSSFDSFD